MEGRTSSAHALKVADAVKEADSVKEANMGSDVGKKPTTKHRKRRK